MATPYADNPSGGYTDFPTQAPVDPPDDDLAFDLPNMATGNHAFPSSPAKSTNVPPVASFHPAANLAPAANSREIEMSRDVSPYRTQPYYSENPQFSRYRDDPSGDDSPRPYHDGEFDSVFVDGAGPRGPPPKNLCYQRKALGTCFLGFFLGTVVMVGLILITGDRSGLRLGGDSGNVDGLDGSQQRIDVTPIVNPDDRGKDKDMISVWVSGEVETAEKNDGPGEAGAEEQGKSNKVDHESGETNAVEGAAESPLNDGSEEVGSNRNDAGSNNEKSDSEAEGSGAVTPKAQVPDSLQGEGSQNDPTLDAAKDASVPVGDEASNDSNVEPTKDVSDPRGETQKDSAGDPVKDASIRGDNIAQDGLDPASAEDGLASVPGKDEAQNDSTPAETNEEGIPPKDNQANADTSAPQTPPGDIPGGPRDNPDLSRYCGSCRWKATKMSCDQRVEQLFQIYNTDKLEAKTTLMKQGHCPSVGGTYHFLDPEIVPRREDCRKLPVPGQDTFCVQCQWKGSEFDCWDRLVWLKSTYGTPEKEAMEKLMQQGHCKDETTPEERAKMKEKGTDLWCGYCKFHHNTCQYRVTGGYLIKDEEKILAEQLKLMSDGVCTLPPYCAEDGGQ